jgi:hypothetical protein
MKKGTKKKPAVNMVAINSCPTDNFSEGILVFPARQVFGPSASPLDLNFKKGKYKRNPNYINK